MKFYLLGFLLGIVILVLEKLFLTISTQETQETVITSNDDPALQLLIEQRTETLEKLVSCIGDIFHYTFTEKDIDVKNVGNNSNLVNLLFKKNDFKIYANWSKNKIKIDYTYNYITKNKKSVHISKSFKIRDDFLDYYKVNLFLIKCVQMKNDYLLKLNNQLLVAQELIKQHPNFTDEEINQLLFTYWKKNLSNQTKDQVYLNAYIYYYFPEQFDKLKK